MVRHRLARLVALTAVFAAVAGCSGQSPADPYQLLDASLKTSRDPVQVNVGFQLKAGTQSITIDRSAIGMVLDTAGQKAGIHVSLPASDLGLTRAELRAIGIDASSIQLDAVFDSDAIYAKSPLLLPGIRSLLGADAPSGDLTGWLRVASREELADLGALSGGAIPSARPFPSTTGSLKTDLESTGITLTLAGTEKVGGRDTNHLKAAVDGQKLLSSPLLRAAGGASAAQLDRAGAIFDQVTLSSDVWIDVQTNHLTEVDAHVAVKNAPTAGFTVTIVFADPDGTIPTTAPASHVDLPAKRLFQGLMKLVVPGLPVA